MTTKRKPYVIETKNNWWKKNNFYKFYLIRESTSIFQIWFSFLILYGVFSLKIGEDQWLVFINFLKNPVVYITNIITFIFTLIHTITWFNLIPKAINIIVNNNKIPEKFITFFFWIITILINIVIYINIL